MTPTRDKHDEEAERVFDVAQRKYNNKVYRRSHEAFIAEFATALRETRRRAIEECAQTINCPKCEGAGESTHINAHDAISKIRSLGGGS